MRNFAELDAADDAAGEDLTGVAERFEALIADAPDEVAADLRTVVDAFAELDAIDEDDPAAFELVFELFERSEFLEASERLERFGVEECGLEPSDGGGASDVTSDAAEEVVGDDGQAVTDGEVKTTTVPGDPYDEAFWGPIDPDEISIPGLEQHLDVNYPSSGWFGDKLSGSSISGDQLIVFADVDPAEALRLCAAVVEYTAGIDPDVTVEIEESTASRTLATGTVADGCTEA